MVTELTNTITKQTSVTVPQGAITVEEESNKYQLIRFFFDTVTDDTVNFQSQITDNWVENNTAIQDHVAVSPVTITMRGLCGELIYTSEQAEKDYETELAQANYINNKDLVLASFGKVNFNDVDGKLTAVSAYYPEVSNVTRLAQDMWDLHEASQRKARKISNILAGQSNKNLNAQMNAYSGLSSNAKQSKLKEVGEQLKNCWMNRKSFTANTPFGDFENMYIQSVTLHQGNENFIGEIDITLKQIRFANTLTTKANKEVLAKYNAYARAEEQNYGKANGENSELYNNYTPGSPYKNK